MAGFLELSVYGSTDPKKRLDVLPRRADPAVLDEVEGPGSGSFSISAFDPKLSETAGILDYRNVVKFTRDGVVEGAFVIQKKDDTLVGSGEAIDKRIIVAGEGLRTWTRDAVVAPVGGLKPGSKKERSFSWASEKGSWYKSTDWVAATRCWPWELTPTPTTPWSPYRYVPANWPDSPDAWWIWSIPFSATSQAPLGVNYFRYEFDNTTAGKYSLFAAGDNTLEAYIDAEQVIDSGDDELAFNKTFRADFDLDAGHHVVAIKVRNTEGPSGGLLASLSRVGDAAAGVAATIVTYTGAPGWLVNGYPAKEPGWTVGEIVLKLLSEAKTRGVKFPDYLTPTFTATTDSSGAPWDIVMPWTFSIGAEYYEVFDQLEELACEIWINPDTYALNIWNKRGTDRSIQSNTAEPVILREGKNLKKASVKGHADIKNSLFVLTADGWIESVPPTNSSQTAYGRVEGKLESNTGVDAARELAKRTFEQRQAAEEGSIYDLHPLPGAWPMRDFFVGDWVLAPSKAGLVRRRVVSISATETDDSATPSYAVEFDTIFQTREQNMARLLKIATGGGAVSASGGGTASSASNASIGGEAASIPAEPTNVVVSSVGTWNAGGGTESQVTVRWTKVTKNINNSVTAIAYYEVFGRPSAAPDEGLRLLASVSGTASGATFTGISAGVSWDFYVRAATSAIRASGYSTKVTHVTTLPSASLTKPTTPVLASNLGTLTARWDGMLDGNTTPPNFLEYIYAEYSTAQNGTYTVAGSTVSAAGTIIMTGLTIGTQYWVRFVAVDLLGRKSSPSTAAAVTVTGIDTASLAADVRADIDKAKADAAAAGTKADTAVSTANTANTKAGTAQTAADKASADALTANNLAASKGKVIFQPTAPTGANADPNNLWINTTNGANTPNRYDATSGTWSPSTDKVATDAAANAVAAKAAADKAAADAASAAILAGTAQTSADSKNRIWYQDTAPAGTGHKVGDTWFNTADSNKISRWDGSVWTTSLLGSGSIAPGAVAAGNLAQTVNDRITKGIDDAATAKATADGKSRNWPTSVTPPTSGMVANDMWTRSTDGSSWRYSGSLWVQVPLATQGYVQSRGTNLVSNGTGLLGDNTNFSTFLPFDGTDHPSGSAGMFATAQTLVMLDELIPIDPVNTYEISFYAKQLVAGGNPQLYSLVAPFDGDGLAILPYNYTQRANTQTTLTADLKPGDTVAQVASITGWSVEAAAQSVRYFAVWNWVDGKGYAWPPATYTRRSVPYASVAGNSVTLSSAWTGPVVPAGTPVGNAHTGSQYLYPNINVPVSVADGWMPFSGRVAGLHTNPAVVAATSFPLPTVAVKVGFLPNRGTPPAGSRQGFAGVAFNEITVAANAAALATSAQTIANSKNTITTSPLAPTAQTPGKTVGDLWWVRSVATGVITAQYEWTGNAWSIRTVDNAVIANINAGKIDAGFLSADRIAAATISASKLTLGDFTNLLDDPGFGAPLGVSWTTATPTRVAILSTSSAPGRAMQLTAASTTVRVDNGNNIPVSTGAQFQVRMRASNTTGVSQTAIFALRNDAGTAVVFSTLVLPPDAAWKDYELTTPAAPDTVSYASLNVQISASTTTGVLQFARPSVRRLLGGELIVDGSITAAEIAANTLTAAQIKAGTITATEIAADTITAVQLKAGTITAESGIIASLDAGKITAGTLDAARIGALSITAGLLAAGSVSTDKLTAEAVTAEKIKANTITAVQIAAGTISANEIKAGTLTATELAANSITTEKLAADAITAKHTITGALIRTAATGARTEMNQQGIRTVDAAGNELVKIGFGIANGMSIRNPILNTQVSLADAAFGAQAAAITTAILIRIDPDNSYPWQTFGDSLVLTFSSWSSKVIINWGAHVVINANTFGVAWPYFMARLNVNGAPLAPNGAPVTAEGSITDTTWGRTITGATSLTVTPGATVTLRLDYKIVTGTMAADNRLSINNRFISIVPAT